MAKSAAFCALLLAATSVEALDQRALDRARRQGALDQKKARERRLQGTTAYSEEKRRLVADDDDALARLYGAYGDAPERYVRG